MYYPKNNDYDKSMGLIANTSIYEFNYKTKKGKYYQIDTVFANELKELEEKLLEIVNCNLV